MERTFVAIKPDAVLRGLIGEIIKRIENKGYKIIGLKLIHPTNKMAQQHYIEHLEKPFFKRLVKYITSGPIVAMVITGNNVIEGIRHIVGSTDPNLADVGTIRGDFGNKMEYNVIHASDCEKSANREIKIYFNENELYENYKTMTELINENGNKE